MMMFVGNAEKVYILDKAEGNDARINDHPAWGAVWDINTHNVDVMDVKTNVFCASGMHLPNGSFVTFGGNGAITVGGEIGSVKSPDGFSAIDDATYKDPDGTKSIRIVNPCTSSDNFADAKCQWFDDPSVLSMQRKRWYSAAEPLADGSIVIVGGFVNGGYVNRNFPNTDPAREGGAAEPSFEFFPANGRQPVDMNFMVKTSGLNAYAHTYLMPSGLMFVQANLSSILWDYKSNTEVDLPDMPGNVARVYPASGATAMLPLTKANGWNPTVLFCGGSDMPADAYGDYKWPSINTWEYPASKDCQRITPEPADGSKAAYQKDDDMLEGRTMGQFIALPDGKYLVVNGGAKGTAGYAKATGQTADFAQMPFGMSLAAEPVMKPALYDPDAAKGSRWSDAGFSASTVPRLYHSSAILLPDASVLIAGSNPNVDVDKNAPFPTTYKMEIFYPSYFSSKTRPDPQNVPKTLTYGGNAFDITIPASSYSGSANDAAEKTKVTVVRPGWTTHGMNMGQRLLQLDNSYTVNDDGSIVLHVAQMPPNANIFQPGPAMLFVVVNGIPSKATMVIVGSGKMEEQTLASAATLPEKKTSDKAKGSGSGSSTSNSALTTVWSWTAAVVAALASVAVL
ncbi:glyoxal oxidase [Flagelloscypha sp. PMI_526]|nr:glyoxal oxidase [Flagelloscypha sp. PMI_526]